MQQHGGADADRAALHGRDQRFGRARDRVDEARDMTFAVEGAGRHHRELADVVAGGEHVALAAQHDHADRLIGLGGDDGVGQSAIHGIGDGVLLVGPREGEGENMVVVLDLDVLGHSSSPLGNLLCTLVSQRETMSISASLKPSVSRALSSATPALVRASALLARQVSARAARRGHRRDRRAFRSARLPPSAPPAR